MLLCRNKGVNIYMENEYSTTEAQRRASKNYEQRNPEAKQYRNKKSATKNFITQTATEEDFQLVLEWVEERLKNNTTNE